ncbi:hypothetical protein JCM8547_004681 [Rhodosporidiobolus lusitaniae]
MPTIDDYASDPDDLDLPLEAAPAPPTAFDKGKGPAIPEELMGAEPTIPKALRVLYNGSLCPVQSNEYTAWDTIYPLYVDAKRPQQDGGRRVNKQAALEWPLAEQISKACRMLGFEAVFEPTKTHPKDWENPGRIKVQFRNEEGKPKIAAIPTKRVLLTRVCEVLRPHQPKAPPATESNPNPLPPIHQRLPPNSPAISHGVLEDAVKGGGPLGALGGMFGGGDDGAALESTEDVRKRTVADEIKKKQQQQEKMAKQLKKIRVKGKR